MQVYASCNLLLYVHPNWTNGVGITELYLYYICTDQKELDNWLFRPDVWYSIVS